MNTQTDLAELRRLHEAATKGEWRCFRYSVASASLMVGDIVCQPPDDDCEQSLEKWPGNASFIAAAHNALPALLDDLEAAREEVRRLTQANEDLRREPDRVVAEAMMQDGVVEGLWHKLEAARAELEALKVPLAIYERHTKLIGAAEELERLASVNQHRMLDCNDLTERATRLRQEAEDANK